MTMTKVTPLILQLRDLRGTVNLLLRRSPDAIPI